MFSANKNLKGSTFQTFFINKTINVLKLVNTNTKRLVNTAHIVSRSNLPKVERDQYDHLPLFVLVFEDQFIYLFQSRAQIGSAGNEEIPIQIRIKKQNNLQK